MGYKITSDEACCRHHAAHCMSTGSSLATKYAALIQVRILYTAEANCWDKKPLALLTSECEKVCRMLLDWASRGGCWSLVCNILPIIDTVLLCAPNFCREAVRLVLIDHVGKLRTHVRHPFLVPQEDPQSRHQPDGTPLLPVQCFSGAEAGACRPVELSRVQGLG